MPCADGTSRKYECPNCISRLCQVKERFVEPHIDEVSNIFAKHVMGPEFANDAAHFRPEVAGVLKALFGSDTGKGLAGEAAGEQREFSFVRSCMSLKRGTSGQCFSSTAVGYSAHSHWQTVVKPAASAAMSMPPIPVNRLKCVNGFKFFPFFIMRRPLPPASSSLPGKAPYLSGNGLQRAE